MESPIEEFAAQLKRAAGEMAQKEQIKQSLTSDISDLTRERDARKVEVEKMKEFLQESESLLASNKKQHEKLCEDKNEELHKKEAELDLKEAALAKREEQIGGKEKSLLSAQEVFKSLLAKQKDSEISKSEQFKKLIADLKF